MRAVLIVLDPQGILNVCDIEGCKIPLHPEVSFSIYTGLCKLPIRVIPGYPDRSCNHVSINICIDNSRTAIYPSMAQGGRWRDEEAIWNAMRMHQFDYRASTVTLGPFAMYIPTEQHP
jgi:hypothetical protein